MRPRIVVGALSAPAADHHHADSNKIDIHTVFHFPIGSKSVMTMSFLRMAFVAGSLVLPQSALSLSRVPLFLPQSSRMAAIRQSSSFYCGTTTTTTSLSLSSRRGGGGGGDSNRRRRSGGGVGAGRSNSGGARRPRRPRDPPPAIPPPGQPGRGCFRELVVVGHDVYVVQKDDQRTGVETHGTVARHLTNSPYHPRGIKVMLTSGQVGRVTRFVDDE
jgi:uncharacterized repeat protein (TIGR03833 family)